MHERHGKVSKAWNAGSYATMIERQPALTARAKRRIVPVSDETPAQRAARSAAAVSQIRFGQAAASAVPVQQKRAPGSRGSADGQRRYSYPRSPTRVAYDCPSRYEGTSTFRNLSSDAAFPYPSAKPRNDHRRSRRGRTNRPHARPPPSAHTRRAFSLRGATPATVQRTAAVTTVTGLALASAGALAVSYVWAMSHRAWNSLMHSLHGNGSTGGSTTPSVTTRLVSRLYTEGMPVLSKVDETSFISWTIDFRGWCQSNAAIYKAIVNRGKASDGTPNAADPDGEAEGLKYLCAAISDTDIRATVAGAANGSGIAGFAALIDIVLQGTEEQPTIESMLNKMRYNAPDSVIAFMIKWKKHADALVPKPAALILTARFAKAISANTGTIFDDCISAVTAQNLDDDLERYLKLLTKLCSRKLERANDPEVNAHATGTKDSVAGLQEQLTALRTEMRKMNNNKKPSGPPNNDRNPNGPRPKNNRDNPRRGYKYAKVLCVRCTKMHAGGRKACRLPPKECPFVMPDGSTCKGDHDITLCFFKDPSKCRDPKFRSLIDKKL